MTTLTPYTTDSKPLNRLPEMNSVQVCLRPQGASGQMVEII